MSFNTLFGDQSGHGGVVTLNMMRRFHDKGFNYIGKVVSTSKFKEFKEGMPSIYKDDETTVKSDILPEDVDEPVQIISTADVYLSREGRKLVPNTPVKIVEPSLVGNEANCSDYAGNCTVCILTCTDCAENCTVCTLNCTAISNQDFNFDYKYDFKYDYTFDYKFDYKFEYDYNYNYNYNMTIVIIFMIMGLVMIGTRRFQGFR